MKPWLQPPSPKKTAKVPARDPNTQEMEAGDQKFKAIPGYMASFEIKKEKKHNLEALQTK